MLENNLTVDPSIWNVIKFIIISVIVTPLLEALYDRLICAKATWDALRGRTVNLSDSRLGIFALHSTYWGPRRNVTFSLFLGLIVLGVQLLLEFSFSSISVYDSMKKEVWLQPNHEDRYVRHEANWSAEVPRDPTRFPEIVSMLCIEENLRMIRVRNGHADAPQSYIPGYEYRTNRTFTIRKPYLDYRDNVTVRCSHQANVAYAEFISPRIIVAPGDSGIEGFFAKQPATGFPRVRAAIESDPFKNVARVQVIDAMLPVSVSKTGSCIRSRVDLYFCVVPINGMFVIASTELEGSQSRKLRTVLMEARGKAVAGLKERGRQIRLLASIISDDIVFPWSSNTDLPISAHLARKEHIESIARMILIVANEEGVGGMKDLHGIREIKGTQEVQRATVKMNLAIPCVVVLFAIMILIVVVDVILRLYISLRWQQNVKCSTDACVKVRSSPCIDLSSQWLRSRIANDLRAWYDFDNITQSDVQFRLIRGEGHEHFTVLPDPTQHKCSNGLGFIS